MCSATSTSARCWPRTAAPARWPRSRSWPARRTRPLYFDADGRLVGRRSPGKGDEFVCAPHGETVPLGFCGIQAVSPAIFGKMSETGAFPLAEAYLRLAGAGEAILAHRVDGAKWRDCGRPEDLRPL